MGWFLADRGKEKEGEEEMEVGLCGNREDHEPHLVTAGSLAPYHCTADQTRRLPYAAEKRRQEEKEKKFGQGN